jgi:hypothetical protein
MRRTALSSLIRAVTELSAGEGQLPSGGTTATAVIDLTNAKGREIARDARKKFQRKTFFSTAGLLARFVRPSLFPREFGN